MADAQREWEARSGCLGPWLFSDSLWGLDVLHTWTPRKQLPVGIHKCKQQKLTLVDLNRRGISGKDTGELLNCWEVWRTRLGCQTGRSMELVWWEPCCPHHKVPDPLACLSDPANDSHLDTRDCHWPCCLGCARYRILLLWLPPPDLTSPRSLCLHVTGFSFKVQCNSLTEPRSCPNPSCKGGWESK